MRGRDGVLAPRSDRDRRTVCAARVGPRAFENYEAGSQAVSVPMSRLLTLLANDPSRIHELEAAVKPAKRPRKSA